MSEITYYQRIRDVKLDGAKKYYKNNKKLLRENAKINIEINQMKKKNIMREYGRNRYHNMSEKKKQKLKEHQKNYSEAKKPQSSN